MKLILGFGNQILNKHDSSAQVPVADARSVKLKQNIVIIRFYSVQPSLANSFHIILGPNLQNFKERFFSRKNCFSSGSPRVDIGKFHIDH